MESPVQCRGCGNELSLPEGAQPDQLTFLRAESGWLIMRGPEEPIHRCDTLLDSDAEMLLQDAEWLNEQDDLTES
jgi:hypothetical protein